MGIEIWALIFSAASVTNREYGTVLCIEPEGCSGRPSAQLADRPGRDDILGFGFRNLSISSAFSG
jgi:hypothetical protein